MAPVPASVAKQAALLKADGNTYIKKDHLVAAIDVYTKVQYMLGLALLREDNVGGVKELEKAFDLESAKRPDHLVEEDPVITPCGITCERAVLLEHLRKVGYFDPITREPLEPKQLVPNPAIKEAVRAFLNDHGWAYKMN